MEYPVIGLMKKVDVVDDHLTDEMSKKLYEIRLKYFLTKMR